MRHAALPLTLTLALLAGACGHGEEAEPEAVVAVTIAHAERGDVREEVSAVGTVTARVETTVSSKVASQIASMGILKNRFVKAGEVIATLEARDLQAAALEADAAVREARASLRQTAAGSNPNADAEKQKAVRDARANVRTAEALVRRRTMLFDRGGIAKKDLEDAQAALEHAQAELDLAEKAATLSKGTINPTNAEMASDRLQQAVDRAANAHAQLDYATIRSPIAGMIGEQFHREGDYVAAGEKLVSVLGTGDVLVKAQFPDLAVRDVKSGASASIQTADSTAEPIGGAVELVGHTADPASRTVEVWITVPSGFTSLRPGDFAKVTIVTGEASDAVTVPASAVTFADPTKDTGTVMTVDEESVAHETEVTVGVRGRDAFEITEGLEEGVTVITVGNYALPDGTKVRTVEAAKPAGEEEEHEGGEAEEKPGEAEK